MSNGLGVMAAAAYAAMHLLAGTGHEVPVWLEGAAPALAAGFLGCAALWTVGGCVAARLQPWWEADDGDAYDAL